MTMKRSRVRNIALSVVGFGILLLYTSLILVACEVDTYMNIIVVIASGLCLVGGIVANFIYTGD